MSETVNILFIIDVSGSMYGQKIASVNASLTECMAELKQIVHVGGHNVKISLITFAEKMRVLKNNENLDSVSIPHINVEAQGDGFYPVTSFGCLYNGLKLIFENSSMWDGKDGKNTFVFLFSDAKPVDEKAYNAAYEDIQNNTSFRNSVKYFGYVEDGSDKFNRETVRFVENKADHIVRASEMSGEISKLQMTFFADFTSQSDKAKYDQIFV